MRRVVKFSLVVAALVSTPAVADTADVTAPPQAGAGPVPLAGRPYRGERRPTIHYMPVAQPRAGSTYLVSARSCGDRRMHSAATFSSRCAIDDVPGIGTVMGERASNHAMAI